jgi:vacuolar-type H+-ATPase subunit I/STV1
MNIGIEMVVSLLTSAVGIGIAYATLKTKIDHLEKSNDQYVVKEYLLQLHKESTDEQKQLAERIVHEQVVIEGMQKELSLLRENHGGRIVRLEEAMDYIKRSVESIDKKLDNILAK